MAADGTTPDVPFDGVDEYLPEKRCSWCGGDLSDVMEVERVSFDTALEGHVVECEPWLIEQGEGE